jgi:undecaprenyl-diphosphatase
MSMRDGVDDMEWWKSLILGLVEGLTEYLPVSSTGHLLLAQDALGIQAGETANAYAICIQAGAIAAVLGLYRHRVGQIIQGLLHPKSTSQDSVGGRHLGFALLVAFLPAAVIGLLFDEKIEEHLFGLGPIMTAWFVGGVAILVVTYWAQRRKHGSGATGGEGAGILSITFRAAFLIGLLQCVAMWPGTSRSLMTIVGGLLVGLEMAAAVEFSFLLGLITLGAATAYKGLSYGPLLVETYGPLALVVGFLAAWVSAALSVRWMVGWLKSHGLAIFGWYRIALAAAVFGLVY